MNNKDKKAIDKIVWWIHIKSLRVAIINIYYEYKNSFNKIYFLLDRFNYIYKNIYNLKYHQKSKRFLLRLQELNIEEITL